VIIKVGTNNSIKVDAVRDALTDYTELQKAEIFGVNVLSGVSEQPKTRQETAAGALNRAVGAQKDGADLGIGIESGLMLSPLDSIGVVAKWLNFTAAVIYDGHNFHYGQSTAFPLSPRVADCIINHGMDLDQAAYACNYVDVPNIGKVRGGFLGVLTKGRISRKTYSKQALMMALISWENGEMFDGN